MSFMLTEEAETRRKEAARAAATGERNHCWKGDQAGYWALHSYLSRHYPKSGACVCCGAQSATYYALIHGRQYSRDRHDYLELCAGCHSRYDQGGDSNPQSKLTWAQVKEIRSRYRPSRGGGDGSRVQGSQRALAAEFGVSRSVIKNIVQGHKWKPSEVAALGEHFGFD